MGHASVDNTTPWSFEAFHLVDEEGRPVVVPLIKATYAIADRSRLRIADAQTAIDPGGRRASDDPDASWVREPESCTFLKPATDVVLVGHAVAPAVGTKRVDVRFGVGALDKRVAVFGDRFWVKTVAEPRITDALPFDRIPLTYERALGGWDRSDPNPENHRVELRNWAGVGFRAPNARFEEGPLPNLEDPGQLLTTYAPAPSPPPAGTGFVSPNWEPRATLGGRFDADWEKERMPLLPSGFDRRFFNAASPGLVADGYLAGGEKVVVEGVHPEGPLSFELPTIRPPVCRVGLRRLPDAHIPLHLDTVVVDADALAVYLTWRGHLALADSAHDVRWYSLS